MTDVIQEYILLLIKTLKIIAVIFNKDFYYSEIIMSKYDFEDFKKFINNVSEEK